MIRAACFPATTAITAIMALALPRPLPAAENPATQAPLRTAQAATPAASRPDPLQDSAVARQWRVGTRPFSREDAKRYLSILNFNPKGKPESTAVNWIYRDQRGALLIFEKATSEWAYAYDSVAFLEPREYVPDSLIRTRTDGLLKGFLKEKADSYAFVNYEKTMVQARDTASKEGAAPPVPAYYIGRYLRKLDGRYVLGDNFQVRIGVGRANAVSFISFREPVLTDSSLKVKVPTQDMVRAYLEKWARDKSRLGRRVYPYHPDKLRIRSLKPVKVFESYVLVQEKFRDNPSKDGTYLAPKVTVLAEAVLAPSQKRLKLPAPPAPVLLHFHFPCTPGAGLCWPDGEQGLEDGPRADIGPRPVVTPPTGSVPPSPKPEVAPSPTGVAPAQTKPAPGAK